MTAAHRPSAPIDLNDAGPQIPCDEARRMLDFNDVEPVDEETARAIERNILGDEECSRNISVENR